MEKNKSIDGLSYGRQKTTSTQKSKKLKSKPSPKKSIKVKEVKATERTLRPQESANNNFIEPVKAFDFDEATGDLKTSQKTESKKSKIKKTKKKAGKVRKTLTVIALIIVLILIGGGTWLILWGNDIIAKITGGQGNIFDLLTFTTETYEPLKTDENGRTNILAFGTSGYNMEGDEGKGKHDGAQLTDSIMAISLHQTTGDVAMLSLPRDLKASPTCTATGKINEIYWCNNQKGNNEQAGAESLMTEVSSILGLEFQYYAHLNWGSLIQIVDILDGITVTLDEDISDRYYTGAVYKAGIEYTLNGNEALGLARARHGTTSGDFSRGASQQKILIGIKNKLLEKNLSITDYLSLASSLGDNLRTNFSVEELKSIAHLSSSLDLENPRQISLIEPTNFMTTRNINDISYVVPSAGVGNYGKIQNYVAKMTSSDPRVYEEPTILILNGTNEDGLAATEKSHLEQEGYTSIVTDNAPDGEYANRYTIYALSEKPGTKNLLERHYNTSAKSSNELPENLPSNYDFIIILGGQAD